MYRSIDYSMANHCYNTIIVRSKSKKAIQEFIKAGSRIDERGRETLKFEAYCPVPDGIEDSYDWRVNNWGTKWCEDFEVIRRSDHELELHAYSAWSGPIGYFIAISKRFNKLIFEVRSSEPANGYNAYFVIQDGLFDNRTGSCTLKLRKEMRRAINKMNFYDKSEALELLDEHFSIGSFMITNSCEENIEDFLADIGAYEAEETEIESKV